MARLIPSLLVFAATLAAPLFLAAQAGPAPIERHTPQSSAAPGSASADTQRENAQQQGDNVVLDPRDNDRTGPIAFPGDYGSGYYAGRPAVVYAAPYGGYYPYAYPYGYGLGFGFYGYGYGRPYPFYGGFRGPYGFGGTRGGFIGGRGFGYGGGFRGGPGRR